jgi:Mg-chelatase subunit ChlD
MKSSSIKRAEILIAILSLVLCFSYQVSAQDKAESNSSPVPITYGLVVDRSGSMRSKLNEIIQAGQAIVAANQTEDETFLVSFITKDKITTEVPITKNKREVISALDDLYPMGGLSAVIDAVYFSAEYAVQNTECESNACRRTLILISDGEDRESSRKEKELLNYLKENKVRVLIMGVDEYIKRSTREEPSKKAASFLKRLASETNGKVFFPKNIKELNSNIQELLVELRK